MPKTYPRFSQVITRPQIFVLISLDVAAKVELTHVFATFPCANPTSIFFLTYLACSFGCNDFVGVFRCVAFQIRIKTTNYLKRLIEGFAIVVMSVQTNALTTGFR